VFRSFRGIPRHSGQLLVSIALVLTAGLALVACGGGDDESSTSGSGAGTAPAESATVRTVDLPGFGAVLATGAQDTIYVHTADPQGGSSCTGKCAKEYKPVEAKGELTAGPDVEADLLSSFTRKDGTKQVLYNDKALYTHTGQGSISGAGVESFGGTWLLMEPSGSEIDQTETGGY